MRFILPILAGLAIIISVLHAETSPEEAIRAAMHDIFPDEEITGISTSKLPGIYEVLMGTNVFYITGDGQYLFRGDLFDLKQRRNISENQRAALRAETLRKVPESEYIEFAPRNPDSVVYVFTDVTCGFCRKLHNDMDELNRRGLAVRYLAFPRNGIDSEAYAEMVSVWCAEDRQSALTAAKNDESVAEANCPNPVRQQYEMGSDMGVRGTPGIYTRDGTEIRGYRPPETLVKLAAE